MRQNDLTPEEFYILATLVEDLALRIRGFDGKPAIVHPSAGGRTYRVSREQIARLTRLGYLEACPESGGWPELTDKGRARGRVGSGPR